LLTDALDRVSVQLKLGDDGGREINPAGVQVSKRDRLIARFAQRVQQSPLLRVKQNHRPDCRPRG
jgi:hypothetical protein